MPHTPAYDANIFGSRVAITNFSQLCDDLQTLVHNAIPSYICFATAHMIVETTRKQNIYDAYANATLISPDGVPVAWLLRLLGAQNAQCVSGPRALPRILTMAAENGIPVGFYGGRPDTLRLLSERIAQDYPLLQLVYSYSPPFRPLSAEEQQQHLREINESGTRILFVGLGSPKQEIWMHMFSSQLNCVCLGVGAAFEFFSGEKHLPPLWVQSLGLTWMVRLMQEPRRLLGRNLYSPWFALLAARWLLMSHSQRISWLASLKRRSDPQQISLPPPLRC